MIFSKNDILALKKDIADDNIDTVLQRLMSETVSDTTRHNDVIMTANRFKEHEHRRIHGLESYTALNQERSHIVQALLYIIDNLPIAP